MIVRPKPSLIDLFTIFRLSILVRIAPQIAVLAIFASLVAIWAHYSKIFIGLNSSPFALLGIAVSIFLSFRNGVCYDRWWEARRQLGTLVAEVRSFSRLLIALPGGDQSRRERCVKLLAVYVRALVGHLRQDAIIETEFPEGFHSSANAPNELLRLLAVETAEMLRDDEFGEIVFVNIQERLAAITLIQAACERIQTTPTPFTYSLLLHRTVYAFCFLLPFGLVGSLGFATPLLCAVLAYAFFGLDSLGDELERPFGHTFNALPLYALARTMEINLLESFGSGDVPPALGPENDILM